MKVLVTGSSGHLGEALSRHLHESGHDVVGIGCFDVDELDRCLDLRHRRRMCGGGRDDLPAKWP